MSFRNNDFVVKTDIIGMDSDDTTDMETISEPFNRQGFNAGEPATNISQTQSISRNSSLEEHQVFLSSVRDTRRNAVVDMLFKFPLPIQPMSKSSSSETPTFATPTAPIGYTSSNNADESDNGGAKDEWMDVQNNNNDDVPFNIETPRFSCADDFMSGKKVPLRADAYGSYFYAITPDFERTDNINPIKQSFYVRKYFSADGAYFKSIGYSGGKLFHTQADGTVNWTKPLNGKTTFVVVKIGYKLNLRIYTSVGTGHFYLSLNDEAIATRLQQLKDQWRKETYQNDETIQKAYPDFAKFCEEHPNASEWVGIAKSSDWRDVVCEEVVTGGDIVFKDGVIEEVINQAGCFYGFDFYHCDQLPHNVNTMQSAFIFVNNGPADSKLYYIDRGKVEEITINMAEIYEKMVTIFNGKDRIRISNKDMTSLIGENKYSRDKGFMQALRHFPIFASAKLRNYEQDMVFEGEELEQEEPLYVTTVTHTKP